VQSIMQSLQFAISLRQQTLPSPGFSMSAFLKASHRLRSMCLVSGYLVQKYGRLKAFVVTRQSDGKILGQNWR